MKFFKRAFFIFLISLIPYHLIGQDYPGARDHLALAYYPLKNRLILYGGSGVKNGNYTWNMDMWSWNHGIWVNEENGAPGEISSMSIASITHNKTLLIVGGINPRKGDLNETWILENEVWRLHEGTSPSPRLSPAIAYDPIKQTVFLFSGCVGNNYPADTWEWDGKDWNQKSSMGPEGVCRASLFYDYYRKSIMLFGGVNTSGTKSNNMWEWNGSIWDKVNQGKNIPEPRSNFLIAYDEDRKRAVLFGGSGNSGLLNDLWEWDGRKWYNIEIKSQKPSKRELYGATYHKVLKKIFIYGGRTGFAKPLGDLWSWDGQDWKIYE